jgi:hypothetical protein
LKSRRSGHVKEEELADDGEKLGYQIVALMGEELGEEIDLLIAEAKIAAGISTVEGTGGLSLESEVERGEDVGLEEMGMRDTMPNRDYTNIRWRAGQPPAHEIRLKKGQLHHS